MYSYKTHTNSKPESNSSLRPLLHEVAGHNLINTLYVISACCPGQANSAETINLRQRFSFERPHSFYSKTLNSDISEL